MENYKVALLIFAVLLLAFSAHVISMDRNFGRDWEDAKCTPPRNGARVFGNKPCCKAKTIDIDGTEIKENEFVQTKMPPHDYVYCYNDRDVCLYDCKIYNPIGVNCSEVCTNVPEYVQGT